MNKKLFAFDLDGTLLNKEEVITKEVVEGLRKIRSMGHETVIITGRTWNMIDKIYKDAEMTTPAGVFNGGAIHNPTDDSFKKIVKTMNDEDINNFVNDNFLREQALAFTIETFDSAYVDDINSPGAKLQIKWTNKKPIVFDQNTVFKDVVATLTELKTKDYKVADAIVKEVAERHPHLTINHFFSNHTETFMLEIASSTSRKDFALRYLADYFGIDMKDTIAFGDGNNDNHMLMAAGRGVAMRNAPDSVKEHADEITDYTNGQNGVMRHIFEKILVD